MSGQHDDDDDDQYNEGEEEELPLAELANATVPTDVKSIRACKRCGLLKTVEQFYTNGCENCEEFLVRSFFVRAGRWKKIDSNRCPPDHSLTPLLSRAAILFYTKGYGR